MQRTLPAPGVLATGICDLITSADHECSPDLDYGNGWRERGHMKMDS